MIQNNQKALKMDQADQRESARSLLKDRILAETFIADKFDQYTSCLMRHAQNIATKMMIANNGNGSGYKQENQEKMARPENTAEALRMALPDVAPGAEIKAERKTNGSHLAIFTVFWNNEIYVVPVKDSIMDTEDPIKEARKIAKLVGLGMTREIAHQEQIKKMQDSSPSCDHLEVKREDLDTRAVMFNGPMKGKSGEVNMFTYLGVGLETTFAINADIRGDELLLHIEMKIVDIHVIDYEGNKGRYPKPLPAALVEGHALAKTSRPYLANVHGEIGNMAKVIDYLVVESPLPLGLVPEKYQEACRELRETIANSN